MGQLSRKLPAQGSYYEKVRAFTSHKTIKFDKTTFCKQAVCWMFVVVFNMRKENEDWFIPLFLDVDSAHDSWTVLKLKIFPNIVFLLSQGKVPRIIKKTNIF